MEDTNREITAALGSSESVTEGLLPDETTTCWTCGSEVDVEKIEGTLDRLREYSQQTVNESKEIMDELEELTERRSALEDQQRRRENVRDRLVTVETRDRVDGGGD